MAEKNPPNVVRIQLAPKSKWLYLGHFKSDFAFLGVQNVRLVKATGEEYKAIALSYKKLAFLTPNSSLMTLGVTGVICRFWISIIAQNLPLGHTFHPQ